MNYAMPRPMRMAALRLSAVVLMACAMSLVSTASSAQAEELVATAMQLHAGEGQVFVDLSLNGTPEFTVEQRESPRRVVVTLPGVAPSGGLLEAPSVMGATGSLVAKALVLDVQQKLGGPGTLLAIYLREAAEFSAEYTEAGALRIALWPEGTEPVKPQPASPVLVDTPVAMEEPATSPVTAPTLAVINGAGTSVDDAGQTHIALRSTGPIQYEVSRPSDTVFELALAAVELGEAVDLSLPQGTAANVRALSMEPAAGPLPGATLTVVCRSAADCQVVPSADGRNLEVVVPAFNPAVGEIPLDLASPEVDDLVQVVMTEPTDPAPGESAESLGQGEAVIIVAGQERSASVLSPPGLAGWEPIGSGGTVVAQGGGLQTIPGPRRPDSAGGSAAPALPVGAAPGIGTIPIYLREGAISLDIPSSPVQTALTAIAHYADVDIVIDDGVTGDVSVTMSDVTAEEAIDIICSIKGLVWYKRGSTYIIAVKPQTGGPLPGGDGIVMSYSPQFTDQDSLGKYEQLLQTLHPRVLVQLYQQAGVIVVAGDSQDVQAAIDTLRQADTLTSPDGPISEGQVTQPYTMNSGDPQQLASFLLEVYPSGLTVHPRPNSQQIVLKGARAVVNSALELLGELERQGGRIVSDTYRPTRLGVNVVSAAVNEVFPAVATRVEDQTLIVTGTATDVEAAITHAKAVDFSLVSGADAVAEYVAKSSHVDGLAKVAEQAFAGTPVRVRRVPDTKTIMVMGPEEDVAQAMTKLAEWDLADDAQSVTRTVAIQYEDAGYLAEMIEGLDLHPALRLATSGAMLQVTGPSIVVAEAMDIIAQTDVPESIGIGGQKIVTKRRVLSYVDTATAKSALEDIFTHEMMQSSSTPAPGVATGAAAAPAAEGVFSQFGGGLFSDGPATVPGTEPPAAPVTAPTDTAGPSTNLPPSGEGVPPAVPVGPVATSGPTGGALVVTEEESTHSLILTGPEWAVDRAMALLEQIDVPPHQVVIEAIIADVNRSYLKEKGIRWDFNSTVVGEGATGDDFGGIGFGTFGRQNFSFDADLFLGEESGKSKLLANPSLRAVDGAEGRIQIGDELRFQVLQPTSMGGQPVYTVETVDVGIILEFTPTITEDGRVRLELRAESSSVSGYTAGFPNIRKREARTELIIQNGETIVIGGLVSEDEIETLREVPLLSEIPILGQLFRHRSVERRPQELVFFITPRILYAADGTLNTDEQRLSSGKDTEPMGWVQELPEGLADRIIDTTAGTPVVVAPGAETATAPEPAPAPARIEEAPVDAANPDEIPTVGAVARRHGR